MVDTADAIGLSTAVLADLARRAAGQMGGLRRRMGGSTELRSGVRLALSADHEVWLLCWPPGSSVAPHDHGPSAGAFVVLSGRLTELRWAAGERHERAVEAGQIVEIPRGAVHDVVAVDGPAYSVHAYSPPLQTMSFYGDDGETVLRTEIVEDTPAEFVAS
jgi:quercetin dioxygenase-like cupin family protein